MGVVQAHTCFFTLDLPDYSTEHVMRSKLLYAIYGCAAIDTDVNNPHGTLYQDDDEDQDDGFNTAEDEEAGAAGLDEWRFGEGRDASWLRIPRDGGEWGCGVGDGALGGRAGRRGSGSSGGSVGTEDEEEEEDDEDDDDDDDDDENEESGSELSEYLGQGQIEWSDQEEEEEEG